MKFFQRERKVVSHGIGSVADAAFEPHRYWFENVSVFTCDKTHDGVYIPAMTRIIASLPAARAFAIASSIGAQLYDPDDGWMRDQLKRALSPETYVLAREGAMFDGVVDTEKIFTGQGVVAAAAPCDAAGANIVTDVATAIDSVMRVRRTWVSDPEGGVRCLSDSVCDRVSGQIERLTVPETAQGGSGSDAELGGSGRGARGSRGDA